jgi:hypothetical protein
MIITRKERTNVFRKQVEHEWKETFWKFIEDNPDKPWDWGYLSTNPNITFDIVLAHPDKPWSWGSLSKNTFSKAKKNFVDKRYNEHLSAYRIQQCWNRAISIPTNPMCQRKQKRDYEKCFGILC